MQFINEQYRVVKEKDKDSYGTIYIVEDIHKDDMLKHLRTINLQSDTRNFIEYMKNNFYDYSTYFHPNLIDFHFFNKIRLIDYKQTVANQYYYTFDYFEGINLFKYCKGKHLNLILDLVAELCAAVKFLHLRGFLLSSIDMNDLQVINNGNKYCLKIFSLPYPKKTNRKIIINNESACFEAPEIRKGADFTVLSDIYIIGAIIFYMFSGLNDFQERLEDSLSASDSDSDKIHHLDKNILDLIKKCTAEEPKKRLQSIDDIIVNINSCFDKDYNIIQKQYIQVMPQYRIKPLARYNLIDKILNNIKGHFFVDRLNKVSLVVSPEGVGKDNFLDTLSIKVEQEGFVPVKTVLTESDFLRFSVSEVIVKSITKYMDKEVMEKYFGDISNAISQISQYRSMPLSAESNYSGEESKGKFIQRLNNLITEASRRFKFVFIIDNFQWIDEDSLKLINEILKSKCDSRTYLILSTDRETYNKNIRVREYCSKLKELSFLDTILLKKFSLDDTAEFIRLILGMDKTPYDFAKMIYDKTKVITEQVYDIIYMLFSNNNIFVDDNGCWVLDKVNYELMKLSDADDLDTLNNVYSLNSTYQDILKVISVFGIAVSSDVVGNFVEVKGGELISQLNYLTFISILVRKQNDWGISYSFNSLQLKEAVYESIPVEKRRKYHEKASYILKSKLTYENKDREEELLYQMFKANWHLEVKEYLLSCTKEMIERNSLSQAIQFLEHAYGLFSKENTNDERMIVCSKLGELYERIGEYSKAIFYYNIIESVSKNTNNSYSLIDVYIKKFSLMYKMYDRKTTLKYIALSIRSFAQLPCSGYDDIPMLMVSGMLSPRSFEFSTFFLIFSATL